MSLHIDPMLLAALKRGEEKAFSQLIDQYSQFVYAVAVRMLGDEVEARESSQEVFIKVWQKIDSYKSAYAFRTWLYRIISNTCLDQLRKRKRQQEKFVSLGQEGWEALPEEESQETSWDGPQLMVTIRKLAGKLSHKQHMVFVLHDIEELPQAEIADILQIKKGSVKSNLHLARKAIREALGSRYSLQNT